MARQKSCNGRGPYLNLLKIKTPSTREMEGDTNRRTILIDIAVELEDGIVEHIEVKDGDTAEKVATKFCHHHALPSQLVSPLTDHIVKNIMEISEEDQDVMLFFQEAPPSEGLKTDDYQQSKSIVWSKNQYYKFTKEPSSCFHRYCSAKFASKSTEHCTNAKESLRLLTFPARLLAPTFTSAKKICNTLPNEKKEEFKSSHELSSKMQEFYGRLYNEYRHHKKRMEEVKKLYLEEHKREIERDKPPISVVLQAQLMECTFKPRINQHLQNLHDSNQKLLPISRFDQLFWDAEYRRKRRAEYMEWYPNEATFRPIINKSLKKSSSNAEEDQHKSVFDRLLEYAIRVNEKRQKMCLSREQLVDQESGQKYFQPMTGGKPLPKRNADALPIGVFLHHLKPVYDHKRECLTEEGIQEIRKLANRGYVGAKSARLLKGLRKRMLEDIFDYLDADKDGFVDLTTADTEELTDEVVQDITELQIHCDVKERLSFEKFVQLMHIIWKRRKKGFHLVFKHSKACHAEKFTFQFKMGQYSRILAYHKRRFRSSKQWYRIILKDEQRRQNKVEAMRKERESIEMDECTFKPVMYERFCKNPLEISCERSEKNNPNQKSIEVQKDQQELQGFIFQEAHEHDMPGTVDLRSPLGLIESLKRLVALSQESPDKGDKTGYEAQELVAF